VSSSQTPTLNLCQSSQKLRHNTRRFSALNLLRQINLRHILFSVFTIRTFVKVLNLKAFLVSLFTNQNLCPSFQSKGTFSPQIIFETAQTSTFCFQRDACLKVLKRSNSFLYFIGIYLVRIIFIVRQ